MSDFEIVKNPGKEYFDELIRKTGETEGWAVTGNEYGEFYKGFDDGCIAMYLMREKGSNKCVSAVITAKYRSCSSSVQDLIAVGYFYAWQEFRGKGLGIKVFEEAMKHTADCNVTLIGVEAMHQKYAEKWGLKLEPEFTIDSYDIKSGDVDIKKLNKAVEGLTMVYVKDIDFEKVVEYDRTIVSDINRSKYVKQCLVGSERQVVKVAIDSQNKVVGFGRLSELLNRTSASIGPFYAESPEIAEALLYHLLEDSEYEKWDSVKPRFISSNKMALKLYEKVSNGKLELECIMHSQFSKQLIKVPEDKVYGFFECGLSFI
ncbi:unnamed protein product [Bursaphelenchus okinawaensis]|uniref:DUF1248 domain-containing protein n=1 Tax=Bursaphelenchus okinawaensis TaxID=465554 RepID=A0A811JV98_9BILA|nr:unnamed protein product [Bursaphelenchus okinawaensis]CAG9084169.1 unnamed protein product [Bursaphelenchus okinawaensis]